MATPPKIWSAYALTGGTEGALDSFDGNLLLDGHWAFTVLSSGLYYVHRLNATSGAAESSPDVIAPDTNAGDKRWLLCAEGRVKTHTHASATEGGSVSYNDLTNKPDIPGVHAHTGAGNGGPISYNDLTNKPTIPTAAVASEVNTGTDTEKFVTCDALAGSIFGTIYINLPVVPYDVTLVVGQEIRVSIPYDFTGFKLISAHARLLGDCSTSGLPAVQLYEGSTPLLSTQITIDENEYDSVNAATQPVIDTNYNTLVDGSVYRAVVTAAGTGAEGIEVRLAFRKP